MKQRDILTLMDGVAPAIASLIGKAMAPVVTRLAEAEKQLADTRAALAARPDVCSLVAAAVGEAMAAQPKIEPVDVAALERGMNERCANVEKRLDGMSEAATAADLAALRAEQKEMRELVMGLPGPEGLATLVERAVAAAPGCDPIAIKLMIDDAVAAKTPTVPAMDREEVATIVSAEIEKMAATVPERVEMAVKAAAAALPKVPTPEEVAALIPPPKPGKSVTIEEVAPLVDRAVAGAFATMPLPKDGESVDPATVKAMVDEAVAAIPPAEPGKDADAEVIASMLKEAVAVGLTDMQSAVDAAITDVRNAAEALTAEMKAELAALPEPKEVDREELAALVASEVGKVAAAIPPVPTIEEVVAMIPPPQPGKNVDPEVVAALVAAEVEKAGLPQLVAKSVAGLPKAPTATEVAALVPRPEPGKDADPEVTAAMVDAAVEKAVASVMEQAVAGLPKIPTAEEVAALVPRPEDGKSVSIEEVRPILDAAIAGAFATMRVPEDGKDADPTVIAAMVDAAVKALPPAEPGRDATDEQIAAAVEKVLATWERPKDGEPVTIEELRPLVDDAVNKAVSALPRPKDGKDGVGLAGALKDHEGCLALTLTNGTVVKLGRVDGESGKPGVDGLGFDDLEVADDPMTFTLRLARGERVREWTLAKPTLADMHKGIWREGNYQRGAVVTYGGSTWLAKADTQARPETSDDWQLITKRGRDGKDSEAPKPPTKVKL